MRVSLPLIAVLVVLVLAVLLPSRSIAAANKPSNKRQRIRREWRTLSTATRKKVARAFWTLKNFTTQQGRVLYGPNFNNHDDMLLLHACAVYDPRCDNGHSGPQFMTFHRAFLLKYELSLLAVDPSIKALPYWNVVLDAAQGKYRKDPSKYIFTKKYFGSLWTEKTDNYTVRDGLFANWPISIWSREKYGKDSWQAAENSCVREEWFKPSPCNSSDASSIPYLRDHDDCSPFLARNPLDDSQNSGMELGWSYEPVYTAEDFKTCHNPSVIKNWMDWQNCIESGTTGCSHKVKKTIMAHSSSFNIAELKAHAEGNSLKLAAVKGIVGLMNKDGGAVCNATNSMGTYVKNGKEKTVNFFHSMVHLKVGKDLKDVTTSPNDPGAFTGHHANIDRSNMIWQHKTKRLAKSYWGYPKSIDDASSRGQSNNTICGPYSEYALALCGGSTDSTYHDYHPLAHAWLNGTTLDDVVNRGYAFKNLFECTKDAVDSTGHLIRCSGGDDGYTHREILYWTSPSRTPYIYDNM